MGETMTSPEDRLAELGITLPAVPPPGGSYVPTLRTGPYVYASGQIARGPDGGSLATGKLGAEIDVELGRKCARGCGLYLLAALKAEVGELSRVVRIVKLVVFVASAPDFSEQPAVGNGASDLMAEVFGDAGRHARSSIGVAALPSNAPVEVELIAEVA